MNGAQRRAQAQTAWAPIGYGIGLHVGNVMFGNVGLKDRLTFSAFGASVNEVQRLQELTKKYQHNVIASEAFADYCERRLDDARRGEAARRRRGHHRACARPLEACGDRGRERVRAVL